MFTPLEEKQIKQLNHQLSGDMTIGLIDSQHVSQDLFDAFCDNLSRLVPKINISKKEADPQSPPQILIGKRLRYQAVPAGHELQPFLETLVAHQSNSVKIAEPIEILLKKNKLPASLAVFVAPECKFCPHIVRQLVTLAIADKHLQLTIVDGTIFTEMVQAQQIRSVPTTVLDNQFRWTGSVPLEELIDTISTRDPASLGRASFEGIIKEGGAHRLAAMMLEAEKLFPAFHDLLTHDKWPIRLGAMVVVEEIVEVNPKLAAKLLAPLWNRFHQHSAQTQGDILHVFGEIGDFRSVPWLKSVLSGDFNPEVKEAANEALEKITNVGT